MNENVNSAKQKDDIRRLLFINSLDDSSCIRIRFEAFDDVARQILEAVKDEQIKEQTKDFSITIDSKTGLVIPDKPEITKEDLSISELINLQFYFEEIGQGSGGCISQAQSDARDISKKIEELIKIKTIAFIEKEDSSKKNESHTNELIESLKLLRAVHSSYSYPCPHITVHLLADIKTLLEKHK